MVNVKPISETVNSVTKEYRDRLTHEKERFEQRIANIEKHYQLLPMLDAEADNIGFKLEMYDAEYLYLKLGERPRGKKERMEFAKKLTKLRHLFGCPLKVGSKGIMDEKKRLVNIHLAPADYPNVDVIYTEKLPTKGGRCRIVKKRCGSYATLVCEC